MKKNQLPSTTIVSSPTWEYSKRPVLKLENEEEKYCSYSFFNYVTHVAPYVSVFIVVVLNDNFHSPHTHTYVYALTKTRLFAPTARFFSTTTTKYLVNSPVLIFSLARHQYKYYITCTHAKTHHISTGSILITPPAVVILPITILLIC